MSVLPDLPRQEPGITAEAIVQRTWVDRFFGLAPFILALLIMIPRLASPEFGLLDDGNSLRAARLLAAGQWQLGDVAVGRSRPLYWLFWSLPYLVAGPSPFWYFFANLVCLITLVACVVAVGRAIGMGPVTSSLTAIVFLLIGPVVESFYTLSKGEPLQLILILLALYLALRSSDATQKRARWMALIFVPPLTFLAGITKETVLVMIPISLAWIGAASLARRGPKQIDAQSLRTAAIGFVLGGVLFLIYRAGTVGAEVLGSGYASGFEFSLARILDSGSRWLAWLLRDFLFLLPLAVLPLAWRLRRGGASRVDLLLGSLIWMAGWLGIFTPWVFVTEYYLLPFSLGAAVFGSVVVADALTIVRHRGPARITALALLTLSGILFCANLANSWTVGRLQLAVDKANADFVRFLSLRVPQDGTVLINLQEPTEYVAQIGSHLTELYNRPDIRVTHLDPAKLTAVEARGGVFIASPHIEHQVLLSDRLGVDEPDVRDWNASIAGFIRVNTEEVYRSRRGVRVFAVDPARAFCPLLAGSAAGVAAEGLPVGSILRYCQGGSLIDRRAFSYGWDVYRVNRP